MRLNNSKKSMSSVSLIRIGLLGISIGAGLCVGLSLLVLVEVINDPEIFVFKSIRIRRYAVYFELFRYVISKAFIS